MNLTPQKPLIQKNVIFWANKLLQKEGWEDAFNIKNISENIVDQPKLKTDHYCGNCGEAMTKTSRGIKRPKVCSESCKMNADLDYSVVTNKMLGHINEYLEIKHWAIALQKDVEGKKKKKTLDYVKSGRDDILSCKKLIATTLKQLGLEGRELIGIVFNNGSKIKYLSNGKV